MTELAGLPYTLGVSPIWFACLVVDTGGYQNNLQDNWGRRSNICDIVSQVEVLKTFYFWNILNTVALVVVQPDFF